jgi:hypothetical protein
MKWNEKHKNVSSLISLLAILSDTSNPNRFRNNSFLNFYHIFTLKNKDVDLKEKRHTGMNSSEKNEIYSSLYYSTFISIDRFQ